MVFVSGRIDFVIACGLCPGLPLGLALGAIAVRLARRRYTGKQHPP
jgi:hypothetical protein